MKWHVIYRQSDGAFINHGEGEIISASIPSEWATYSVDNRLNHLFKWNTVSQAFDLSNPKSRMISIRDFMQRIPQNKRIGMRKSADDVVQDLREMLTSGDEVDLNATFLIDGLAYLVAQNMLTQAEADVILA